MAEALPLGRSILHGRRASLPATLPTHLSTHTANASQLSKVGFPRLQRVVSFNFLTRKNLVSPSRQSTSRLLSFGDLSRQLLASASAMSLQQWVTRRSEMKMWRQTLIGNARASSPLTKTVRPRKDFHTGFLNLPAEIRLLIYEAIFTPAWVVLQSGEPYAIIAVLQKFPELISRGFRDVQLFRTCRTCHKEAAPIFYSSINLLVYQHLPLLRLNFLPRIGPLNASFIKRAMITPIGLPGEHQRLLESLGSRNDGLVRLESLTLEIWDPEQVPALVSTCQELIKHHEKLKIVFGRGIEMEGPHQVGDIPARLVLAREGHRPGPRERIIQSLSAADLPEPRTRASEDCPESPASTPRALHKVSLDVPEPIRTVFSRIKFKPSRKSK